VSPSRSVQAPLVLGVNLKMYFGPQETLRWCRAVATLVSTHPVSTSGAVEVFVLPDFTSIVPVLGIIGGSGVHVGGQDLATDDVGAFTGEVSGRSLQVLGCQYVMVGHAERRSLFGDDERVIAAKTTAALRNGLIPVLCVGESDRVSADDAAAQCISDLEAFLADASAVGIGRRVVVAAYEPQWAIGAAEPAPTEHIIAVCTTLSAWLAGNNDIAGGRVIYGGAAGAGLLTRIAPHAQGLFLGRFAHDPASVGLILDEAQLVLAACPTPTQPARRDRLPSRADP